MSTAKTTLLIGARKVQISSAALAIASAAAITPVIAPAISQAAPAVTAAPVLTWGFDQLDSALIAADNDNNGPAAAAAAVAAYPTPVELLQYLVQGIARGLELVIGTPVYTAVAFTGGLFTFAGDLLPGPLGDFFVSIGTTVDNVANTIAQALRVGPYATTG